MDDIDHLDEPPPIHRSVTPVDTHPKPGLIGRAAASQGSDVSKAARRRSRTRFLLVLAALAALGAQGWMIYQLRTDLAHVRTRLDEARSSLGTVWESAKRLDQDRMARLALLADSIRSVSDYAQGEVRLWEVSYATLQQTVEENARNTARNDAAIARMTTALRAANSRMDVFARADQEQRFRLDALDRTHNSAVEALSRRTQTQEATMHDVSTTVASLRETLGKLDTDLAGLEQRLAASSSQYGQLGRRVESLAGWADGFRRAGLSGDALQGQLSSLTDELRRIRIRVDSLRPVTRPGISASDR